MKKTFEIMPSIMHYSTENVNKKALNKSIEAIKNSEVILFSAGAGMGVDSGLPDFRGKEGFWKKYPAFAKLGLSFYELASPTLFQDDPQLAYGFYGHRLKLYRETQPHEGFSIIRSLAKQKGDNYFVYTSNVDGQFQKADFNENQIVECHGSIHYFQCAHTCCNHIWKAENVHIDVDEQTMRANYPLPQCPHCSSIARPNILMFGDTGWIGHRTEQQERNYEKWLRNIMNEKKKLVIIECGAGTTIPTVRNNSEYVLSLARGHAKLVRINKREPYIRDTDGIPLAMRAKEALIEIGKQLL